MKNNRLMIVGSIIILITVGLTGCNENSNPDEHGGISVIYPVMSSFDLNVLDTAYADFDNLKQMNSVQDTRRQLLDKLNNETEGVELAELGVDGYTIFVTLSDGEFTAIDTFTLDDEDSVSSDGGFSIPYSNQEIIDAKEGLSPVAGIQQIKEKEEDIPITQNLIVVGPDEKTTCESNKLLVLAPCYWEFPHEPTDECVQFFRDNGWENHDITLKYASDPPYDDDTNCLELTPEDYFNIEKFGVILFTGHGAIWARNNFEEDNLFLQFCYFTNQSFIDNPQLQKWKDQQKLIVFRKYNARINGIKEYVYASVIRADLLREKMSSNLPSSYCYFATCYGGYFSQAYLDAGAKVFLGWDNLVEANYADRNMKNIAQLMLENDICVSEAFADEQIIKSYPVRDPTDPIRGVVPSYYRHKRDQYVNFNIYPDPEVNPIATRFFMPSWIDIQINRIPEGAAMVQVDVYDNDSNLLVSDRENVVSGETQVGMTTIGGSCFPPNEPYTIEVSALYDDGSAMISNSIESTLTSGENDHEIFLTKYLWNLSGGEDPTDDIEYGNAFGLIIRLNEDQMISRSTAAAEYYYFWAYPGDQLRIRLSDFARPGYCYNLGALWLHCMDSGDKFQLTAYQDLGCWEGDATDIPVDIFDETFTIPEV